MTKQDDFERAEKRIAETPSLQPYEHVLLYDWGDPELWPWVASADVEDILKWAKDVDNLPED